VKVVSIINYKGGVGKTILTANLAAELAWRGKKVLAIDMDPQASLTFSFVTPEKWTKEYEKDKTIKNWFESNDLGIPTELSTLIVTPQAVNKALQKRGQIDLIASHLGLINIDLELATQLGGANMKQAKSNFLRIHSRLADGIESLDEEYDIVLIDCPPNFNIVTKTAIVASESILIPAKPDYLSTMGIDYLLRSLNDLVTDYNDYAKVDLGSSTEEISPEVIGVVFTMIQVYGEQPISAQRPYMKQTKKLGVPVFDSYIRENKSIVSDAPASGVPVVLNRFPGGTHSIVVSEIEEFVSEFITKLGI